MDTDADAELRLLRKRAYGPDADIHDDPLALTRLRQLEANVQPTDRPTVDQSAPLIPPLIDSEQIPRVPRTPPSPAPDAAARPAPISPAAALKVSRWQQIRIPVLWAGSVLLAIAVSISASNAYIQGQHEYPGSGADQVATLQEAPEWEVPSFFTSGGSVDARGFEEFHGMRAIVGWTPYMSDQYNACVSVVSSEAAETSEDGAFNGPIYTGCGANAFPAAATFKVTSDLPQELQQAFPIGTALQFVLDDAGGDIVVFSSTVSAEAAAAVR